MYIWLKNGAEEQLTALKEQGLVGDLRVETDRTSGKKYVAIYDDVFDPTTQSINVPEELIERVTFKDRIHRGGFRVEGIYRHEGATLMVKDGRMYETNERLQNISVSAPSVEQLKSIYTLVRQGKLAPEENWEEQQDRFAPAENLKKRPIAPSWFSRLWSWLRAR